MPLTERFIDQRFSYLNGRFIDEGQEGSSLKDVQMGSMYGTLVQLGYLAQYAHQLLDELCEEARAVDSRITALTGRTKTLVEYMDSIAPPTAFAGGATHRSIASVGPLPEAEPLLVEKQVNGLFTRESQPLAVRNRYRSPAVAEMPELHKIDALLQANNVPQTGPCAVQYSYPEFFFNEWMKEEEARLLKLEEERKQRKAERRARRQQLKEVRGSQKNSAINVKQLDWRKKYSVGDGMMSTPNTAARLSASRNSVKDLIQKRERGPGDPVSPGMLNVYSPAPQQQPQQQPAPQAKPPAAEPSPPPTLQLGSKPAPPPAAPPKDEPASKPSSPLPPPTSAPPPVPPPPVQTAPPEPVIRPAVSRPPPLPSTNEEEEEEDQPPQAADEPDEAPAPVRAPPSNASLLAAIRSPNHHLKKASTDNNDAAAGGEPGGEGGGKRILSAGLLADISGGGPRLRSVSGAGGSEATAAGGNSGSPQASSSQRPPNPMAGRGGLSADLLSSINKGKALKSAPAPEAADGGGPPPPPSAKMSMLSEIKMNKTKLKHVERKPSSAAGTKAGGKAAPTSLATEVQNILARRKFLQAQSDSDSDEDGWKD